MRDGEEDLGTESQANEKKTELWGGAENLFFPLKSSKSLVRSKGLLANAKPCCEEGWKYF